MKHGKKLYKLNRTASHRKALLMNLAISLFKHERIKTTLTKAKAVKPYAEKLITKAKNGNGSIHTIRELSAVLSDKSIVQKLIGELSERFKKRPGGYTRIYKCGFRANDAAPIALIELVDYSGKTQDKEMKTVDSTTVKEKLTALIKPKTSEEKEDQKEDHKKTAKKEAKAPASQSPKASNTKKPAIKKTGKSKGSK
jgi:large subunit ribosomal protein L17